MNPQQQQTTWADLVSWVTWLHDRYELSIEEKLPVCWAQHPGLIEELRALKAWRHEIYLPPTTGPGPPAASTGVGQAARYWHGELRQVLHAATTQYAAGCRAAHRSATSLTDSDPDLHARWLNADPGAGIPTTHQVTDTGAAAGETMTGEQMREALQHGQARPLGETVRDYVHHHGAWWSLEPTTTPGPGRWHQISDSTFSTDLDRAATALRQADEAVHHARTTGEHPHR